MVEPQKHPFSQNVNLSIEAYRQGEYGQPCERYDFVYEKMKPRLDEKTRGKFLDMGCGDASFIYYLKQRHPGLELYGVEISRELLEKVRKNPFLTDVHLTEGDLCRARIGRSFDCALMSGALSIFDDISLPIENMVHHLREGGYGYIFGGFCSEDIDVLVRYRNNYLKSSVWESGLNMFSLKTVERILQSYSSRIHAYPFRLSRDLGKKPDPIRSYTLTTAERGRMVVTGANIIREFFLIEFQKK